MQPLNYAINGGFKLSWKGALIGGTIGSAIGYTTAVNMAKKDPSSGIVACIAFVAFPIYGVLGGTLGGFVCGTTKGCIEWAINGPFEPHSRNDTSIHLGAALTTVVAALIFNGCCDS